MSIANCLKKLNIDTKHQDAILSGLATLSETGQLSRYRAAKKALDSALDDALDEKDDILAQLKEQGWEGEHANKKEISQLNDNYKKLGMSLVAEGKDLRDYATNAGRTEAAKTAERIAKIFNKDIVWMSAKGEYKVNGTVSSNIPNHVFLDVNSRIPAHIVLGHELSHHMEREAPEVYKDLVAAIEPMLVGKPLYNKEVLAGQGSNDQIVKEMIGDLMGDNFDSPSFWNKVAGNAGDKFKAIAQEILKWIDSLLKDAKKQTFDSDIWVKDVNKARDVIAEALNKYSEGIKKEAEPKEDVKESRRIHGDVKNNEDYIVPEITQHKDNMTGDLGTFDGLPIRLRVGEHKGDKKGFGIEHMKANQERYDFRKSPQATKDVFENIARDVSHVAATYSEVYDDKNSGRKVLRSGRLNKALIVEGREGFWNVVTYIPLTVGEAKVRFGKKLDQSSSRNLAKPEAGQNTGKGIRQREDDKLEASRELASVSNPDAEVGSSSPSDQARLRNQSSKYNGNIDSEESQVSLSRVKEEDVPEETLAQKAQRKIQDSFNRFKVVKDWLAERGINLSEQADVYSAEERYHSKVANQLEDFREKVRNPLIEKIAKAGFKLDQVAQFLKAQHADEANKVIQRLKKDPKATAYGMTSVEAKKILDAASPELAKLANEVRSITEDSKNLRLKNGILNSDITSLWDNVYKHYIPVKGNAMDKAETKPKDSGLSVKHHDHRRLGHGNQEEAVLENIFMDYERAVMEVERNRVGKAVVMMAAEANNPDLMTLDRPEKRQRLKTDHAYVIYSGDRQVAVFSNYEAAKVYQDSTPGVTVEKTYDERIVMQASPLLAPNEFNVYIDGHTIRVQLNDDILARAYLKLGIENYGELVAAGRMLNGFLSKVYTGYNPEFIVTNIIRDFTAGVANLTGEQGAAMALKAISNYPKQFVTLLKYASTGKSNELIDSYRENGGNTGAAYLSDLERLGNEVGNEFASYQGVIANVKAGDSAMALRAAGRKMFNATLKWIEHLNQAGENAMRLSAYKAMLDSGKSVAEAAKVAKNITVNFNRRGELGQTANAVYLFFNASVQGVAAIAHANLQGKHKYQANALSMGMVALGYMIAANLAGGDEEEYDRVDEYTKERNLLIKSGDGYLKVPVPYGYGFFFNLGRVMADSQRKGEVDKAPWHLAASLIQEFTPFGNTVNSSDEGFESQQVLGGVLPTSFAIPYQLATNENLFSGTPIYPESPFDKSQPDREKMFRNSKGSMYDEIAGALTVAGADVSPESLKFLTRTFTGGAGALVDSTISGVALKAQGADLDTKEIPFIRKLYTENTISNDRAAYYKAADEAKKAAEEFSRAKRNNDISAIRKVIEDKSELLAMDKYANKLRSAVKAARDMQDAVRLDEKIPLAERRLKLKELEKEEAKLYNNYLNVFKERVK